MGTWKEAGNNFYSNKNWNCPPEWDERDPCDDCPDTTTDCDGIFANCPFETED